MHVLFSSLHTQYHLHAIVHVKSYVFSAFICTLDAGECGSLSEKNKEAARRWKELSFEEKQPYVDQAKPKKVTADVGCATHGTCWEVTRSILTKLQEIVS